MEPPFPALEVLQRDVAAAQRWLNETDVQLTVLDSTFANGSSENRAAEEKEKIEELKVM